MKKMKKEQRDYSKGLVDSGLMIGLAILAGKLFYKISLDIRYEAKILSGILGGVFIFLFIFKLIKVCKRLEK